MAATDVGGVKGSERPARSSCSASTKSAIGLASTPAKATAVAVSIPVAAESSSNGLTPVLAAFDAPDSAPVDPLNADVPRPPMVDPRPIAEFSSPSPVCCVLMRDFHHDG